MEEEHDNIFAHQDVDWFALDQAGHIAHFATGGCGFVPDVLVRNMSGLDPVFDALFARPAVSAAEIVEGNIPETVPNDQRALYLSSFVQMAERGFFSFDVVRLDAGPSDYRLIAAPTIPLNIRDLQLPRNQMDLFPALSPKRLDAKMAAVTKTDWLAAHRLQ